MGIWPSTFDIWLVQYNQTYTGKFDLRVEQGEHSPKLPEGLCSPTPDCQTKLPVGSFGGTGRVYWGQFPVRGFVINLTSQAGRLTIFSRHVCSKDGSFLGTYTISNVKESTNLEIQFSNLNICRSSYGENTSHTYHDQLFSFRGFLYLNSRYRFN